MGLLDFIFGTNKTKIKEFLKNHTIILDVKTPREWATRHIEDALHIPLIQLRDRTNEIKKLSKPVITYYKSGARSAKAASYLNLQNIAAVNGKGWLKLKKSL